MSLFELTEDQKMIQETVRTFAQKEVAPLAEKIDKEAWYPEPLIKKIAELGLMGLNVDPEYGGSGMDYVSYALVGEELNAACASTGVIFSAHNSLAIGPIKKWGNEEQKKKFLPRLASGEALGAFALSEPVSGSDAGALICTCENKGDHFVINGTKNWITNGPQCEILILLATADRDKKHKGVNAFIVDKNESAFTVAKVEEKLGIKGSGTAQLHFDNVKIPAANLLGKEGDGFKIAMTTLDGGRIGIAAQALGIARAAMEAAKKFAFERETFGKPIAQHQAITFMFADMATRLDAARLLTWRAAALQEAGAKFTKEAAMAKLFASEAANFICDKAVQIHGGYGFSKEYAVERHYRDQRITEIYEGTSEIQRLVVGSNYLKEE